MNNQRQIKDMPADDSLVRLFGYQESLSLDARGRFRVPDDLAAAIQRELGRIDRAGGVLPAPVDRLALYFVPGTRKRVFLYPAPNIRLAVEGFENPAPGIDPEVIRRARDYFYFRMRFVEADKQNRFMIPDGLRQHAEIGDQVQQVTLVAHNHWLALSRSELVEQKTAENLEAFEQAAPDLLNPVRRTLTGPTEVPLENDRPATG
jgi:DNA-binding transcriptional regulator/RsmH inhibitor MraZ